MFLVTSHVLPTGGVNPAGVIDAARSLMPFVIMSIGERTHSQQARTGEVLSAASTRAVDRSRDEGLDAERMRFLVWVERARELVESAPTIPEPDRQRLRRRFQEVHAWLSG